MHERRRLAPKLHTGPLGGISLTLARKLHDSLTTTHLHLAAQHFAKRSKRCTYRRGIAPAPWQAAKTEDAVKPDRQINSQKSQEQESGSYTKRSVGGLFRSVDVVSQRDVHLTLRGALGSPCAVGR